MNKWLLCKATVLLSVCCLVPFNALASSVNILFIGNSIVNRNDLPNVLKAYVSSAYPGREVTIGMVAPDGATFAQHVRSGEAKSLLDSKHWDFVVLQGGYDTVPGFTLNGKRYYSAPDQYLDTGFALCNEAKTAGARTIVFETSSRDPDVTRNTRYAAIQLAKRCDGAVGPIGTVENALGDSWRSRLFADDGMHPSKLGTLTAAITLAEAIFGDPSDNEGPINGMPVEISIEEFKHIRSSARTAVEQANVQLKGDIVTPIFSSEPRHSVSEETGKTISGSWRARTDIFRLSLGSEITVAWHDNVPVVELTNYQVAGEIKLSIRAVEVSGSALHFKTKISGAVYDVTLAPSGSDLKVLGSYNSNETTRIFTERTYVSEGEPAYFAKLRAIYDQLTIEERKNGLAVALPKHLVSLKEFIGKTELMNIHQNFPFSEWDEIMVGDAYREGGNMERAIDYYRAATVMYPKSSDAMISLGQGLAAKGDKPAAKAAFLKATVLNAGASKYKAELLRRSLEELSE